MDAADAYRESLHDWLDERDADRIADARMEEWDDAHSPNLECGECGHEWYSPIIRSRDCPPEPRYPDCPECGA
jgi:hypothetical protein